MRLRSLSHSRRIFHSSSTQHWQFPWTSSAAVMCAILSTTCPSTGPSLLHFQRSTSKRRDVNRKKMRNSDHSVLLLLNVEIEGRDYTSVKERCDDRPAMGAQQLVHQQGRQTGWRPRGIQLQRAAACPLSFLSTLPDRILDMTQVLLTVHPLKKKKNSQYRRRVAAVGATASGARRRTGAAGPGSDS